MIDSTRASLLSGVLAALALGGCDTTPVNNNQNYMPAQPIAFSHAVHAGHYEIDCQYCHVGAEKSRHAGIPHSGVCMNCHTQVKTDSPEIQKLTQAVKQNTPIEWVRVHRLPDHAYFNHASHVTSGLECQQCHGPVQEMVRLEQVEPMTMGWCLDCHRETQESKSQAPVPPLASGVLRTSASGVAVASAPVTPAPRTLNPPTDCSGCHR
ncbi:cytochrome c3 family protein [Archangium violaceum]|uniref:cytochrome c3 family protein n=1 Tax=Archangium violaceum TaxID=83451 RepID=UPI001951F467|nr:cytochrome c3 family protein [Archangium violaceum]QRN94778.1 cytochrome c3 family protein [Archangium violaceum]